MGCRLSDMEKRECKWVVLGLVDIGMEVTAFYDI